MNLRSNVIVEQYMWNGQRVCDSPLSFTFLLFLSVDIQFGGETLTKVYAWADGKRANTTDTNAP